MAIQFTTNIEALVNRSIRENSIVHADRVNLTDADMGSLWDSCEDNVDNGETREFWGRDSDGDEWRVHVDGVVR